MTSRQRAGRPCRKPNDRAILFGALILAAGEDEYVLIEDIVRANKSTIARAEFGRGGHLLRRCRRRRVVTTLLVLAWAPVAPATADAAAPDPSEQAAALAAALAAAEPLAATPEMSTWALRHAGVEGDALGRLRRLHGLLTGRSPNAFVEEASRTPTAAEAFATRRADCLGFALTLVALARAARVDAGFALQVAAVAAEDRGSLRIATNHVVVAFAGRVFDLGGEAEQTPRRHRPIGDRTALALFHSNRGAHALAAGADEEAVERLYRALRHDPSLTWVWSNLGVALRRTGDAAGAVLAHEMALRIDPFDPTAHRNLELVRAGPAAPRR